MGRGDYVVVRSSGWAARLIQLGNLIARLRRRQAPGSWRWNHAAIDIGDGTLVEANPHGVQRMPVTEYDPTEYLEAHVDLTDHERDLIVAYAIAHIGTPYGWVDIVALALLTFGVRPEWLDRFAARTDRLVCSQLVAYAYATAGVDLTPPGEDAGRPWTVTPGDLAAVILDRTTTGES